jgi:hypothetical protein
MQWQCGSAGCCCSSIVLWNETVSAFILHGGSLYSSGLSTHHNIWLLGTKQNNIIRMSHKRTQLSIVVAIHRGASYMLHVGLFTLCLVHIGGHL